MTAQVANNEIKRLKVLWQYDILDTVPEEVFDDLTELAARICEAPIALISLVDIHRLPAWMVILIIGREFAVSGLRSIAATGGYMIEASELGKSKMVAQVAAIALVIAGIRWPALDEIAMLAMWTVVLFALVSAADYFLKFWRKVDTHVKLRRRRELLALQRQQRRAMRSGLASSAKVVE